MSSTPDQQSIEQSLLAYKAGLGHFSEQVPEVGEAYMNFTAACFKAGSLGEKEKHLIALGLSVQSQDETCIMYHTQAALQNGATRQDVLETVGVCAAFGGGAALSQGVTLVQSCCDAFAGDTH
ncbi:MAG TPA: carboxymuconolactone decarboxylase family protein [Bacilli bacterium]|nr:carboxymuconolactone decarboxylase family protein [Bacilli bacterium]